MRWTDFPSFAFSAAVLWLFGIILIYLGGRKVFIRIAGIVLFWCGIAVTGTFIALLWAALERPPLRTLGETRLWYVLFLPLIGIVFYMRWKYRWFLSYSFLMTMVFLLINLFRPETHDKALMPALQSPWFVPHVVVYIFGYAMLGVSALVALYGLYRLYFSKFETQIILLADNLVYLGFGFLTLGLLFGALWAKEAWGHYWTWDPKEPWAFLTWLGYLIYIHLRFQHPAKIRAGLWVLGLAFVILIVAWFGINFLPSAQNSVHVYGS